MRIKKSKYSDTFYDIPLLERKGFIKIPKPKNNEETYIDKEGYIGFKSKAEKAESTTQTLQPTENQETQNNFDFLNALANSSSINSPSSETKFSEIAHAKVKIEDLEYKLDRLLERLEKIESKLQELEKVTHRNY